MNLPRKDSWRTGEEGSFFLPEHISCLKQGGEGEEDEEDKVGGEGDEAGGGEGAVAVRWEVHAHNVCSATSWQSSRGSTPPTT